jgi:hypothetical protein
MAPGLWADLTMRHTMTFHFGEGMPPVAAEAMKGSVGAAMPASTTVQMKGDLAYTSTGALGVLFDYGKGTITLLNPKTKQFATMPIAEYGDAIAAAQKTNSLPADAKKLFEGMKLDVKTEKTAERATIHGIGTEERVVTITMEMPGMPGPGMRIEVHAWVATAAELKAMPELKELAAYAARARKAMDPVEMMTNAFGKMPGFGEKMKGPMQEIMKGEGEQVVQMRESVYMPFMSGNDAAIEISMDLAELSMASIPDTVFEVPAEYQKAPASDVLQALFPAAKTTMTAR